MEIVVINATNEGYTTKQVKHTMTVEEVINQLEQFDLQSKVYLSFDNGYTFGGITASDIDCQVVDEVEDED